MYSIAAIDVHGHFGPRTIPRLATGQPTNTENGACPPQWQGYGSGPVIPIVDEWFGLWL
jgi:hypothetical protein